MKTKMLEKFSPNSVNFSLINSTCSLFCSISSKSSVSSNKKTFFPLKKNIIGVTEI